MGCEEKPLNHYGEVEFSFDLNSNLKGTAENPSFIIITIEDEDDETIINRLKLDLLEFNGEFISMPLSLTEGNYILEEFFIGCCENNILLAAPNQNSEMAKFVESPLPMEFKISKDEVTKMSPEVLEIQNNPPLAFGYSSFSFNIVDYISLIVGVMTYDDSIKNYKLSNATVKEYDDFDNVFLSKELSAKTEIINLPKRSNYKLEVSKPGYQSQFLMFTYDSILSFEYEPLIVLLQETSHRENLIAWYPMDASSEDMSENNFDGIAHNVQSGSNRHGEPYSSFYFNGNAYIDMGNILNEYISGEEKELTISCWIKPDNAYLNKFILGKYADSNCSENDRQFNVKLNSNNNLTFIYYTNADRGDSHNIFFTSGYNPPVKEWVHVAVTYEYGTGLNQIATTAIYINGELAQINHSQEDAYWATGPMDAGNAHFSIGNPVTANGEVCGEDFGFKGNIDDVMLFSKALTSEQIQELYKE